MKKIKGFVALTCLLLSISANTQPTNNTLPADQICAEQYHGITFTAPSGSPVAAADDGVVASVSQPTTFGRYAHCERYVVVLHQHQNGKRVYTRYAGIGNLALKNGLTLTVGVKVKRGESLGQLGLSGLLTFEVRPIDKSDGLPNWSAVTQTDPNKFDFSTYNSLDTAVRPVSSWTRYQKQDLDNYHQAALALFQPDQAGTKVFPKPEALRVTVKLATPPFTCAAEGLRRMGAMVGLSIPITINHCVRVTTSKGKVLRFFIQDAVASFLAREIGVSDSVELFVTHVFTNLSNNQDAEAVLGMTINEFNAIP